MDNNVEILLGSQKNINSINVNNYVKLELTNNISEITEFTVNGVVNSTEVFDVEREANPNYRIYGKIEWLSILNGLKSNYNKLEDFFNPTYDSTAKNITNSFNFYLVRPAETGYTYINNTIKYIRYFKIVATLNDFEIFPAGFSNNVYGEQTYSFSFKKDFDVSNYFDNFGFPLTELFLYLQYIPKINGNGVTETMSATTWTSGGSSKIIYPTINLNIGDYIKTTTGAKIGDIVEYDKNEYLQTQVSGQTIYISTEYKISGVSKKLVWKFNPFIPFQLRYFDNSINNVNTGDTSYEIVNSIPSYATKLDNNGNYVWRDILSQGYVEPLTGVGVDYPFINGKRYLFSTIIFSIQPDLNNINTKTVFNEISYSNNTININKTPLTELNNIGKPCQ
jgi:hypothetical protein